jgi:hypothetical protein
MDNISFAAIVISLAAIAISILVITQSK